MSADELLERIRHAVGARYEVSGYLGRGGMGAVVLAKDTTLDREVAIKVLPPELAHDAQLVKRFEHEARTAARLDHPNIIPIYAVEQDGNLHYFVMKYVRGRGLDDLLAHGPLPIREVQRILWDASSALAHAHARGIVHRDVKPANIMLDEAGRVWITDFGISKVLESGSQFTQTGQVLGTPHYMSPEQCRGAAVDGRADQYSLAIVGFKMLTGRVPFDDDSIHTMIYLHVFEQAPRASSLRTDTPPLLDDALAKALAKTPEERFANMEAFAGAIWPEHAAQQPLSLPGGGVATRFSGPTLRMDAIPSTPTPTTPQPLPSPPARKVRRRPLVLAALAVVAGLAVLETPRLFRAAPPAPAAPTVDTSGQARALPDTIGVQVPQSVPAAPPASSSPPARRADAGAAQTGSITVNATPVFGTVYVDGREAGDTPLVSYAVSAGVHVVEIRHPGYRTRVDTVRVVAGNDLRYSRVLLQQH